jgi:hypothetical protein
LHKAALLCQGVGCAKDLLYRLLNLCYSTHRGSGGNGNAVVTI